MKIVFLAFAFFMGLSVYADKIKEINYDGLYHISRDVAMRMVDLDVGDELDAKKVDDAIKKYFQQGYFQDIYVTNMDGNVTFHFKEKPIISKVELKGYKDDDKDFLNDVVMIKRGVLYDEKKIEAAKNRIIESLNHDGKIDSVVEVEKTIQENGSMHIKFVINEGEKIIIQKIKYSGLKRFKSSDFDDTVANKEHQFMGWFWGRNSGELKIQDLQYDPFRIRDYYMQYGYLDAKVDAPFVRVNFDHYTGEMSYQIAEGDVYRISGIDVDQTKQVIDDAKLLAVVKLKKNEPFNIKTFREDSDRIKTIVADLGYAFVNVVPDLQKDKKNHTVNVVFKVIPGEKVRIRNVIISGNTRTLDRIIRRELYLGPGDMYSLTDLKDSRNAIGRLGYFESNTIEEKRIDERTMDLIVKVKETPTGNIQLGGGYGSYGGLLLSVAVSDRNIWGSGINVGVKLEKSQMTHNYSFSISNPRLNDSDYSGNFSIYQSATDYTDYSVESNGVSVGVGHRFTRHVSGYLGYNYSQNTYSNVDLNATSTYGSYYFESYSKSSAVVSMSFDNTDDYYLPREGMIASQSIEKSGIGGDADFYKFLTKFSKYNGLKDYVGFDAIFRYKARFNYAVDSGYLPIAEKFYMGGIGSVRGYQSYSLSPTVLDNGEVRRVGANETFSNNAEISFPLVPKAKMRLVTFLDWGFIGDNSLSEISRGGYGVGMEWFSPVGPIQLMFANPLNQQSGDKVSHFEFTMGQRF
ncbi:outer membrane protein assembly factor BamA [Sulfurimonas sp. HSL-1716]|uniref:outer membrane protein assembly factor BamA n=1 Tax=Hydrocurvibacter sulfurireducens TaxID=3131937 RepID=UPI0031F82350